MSYYKNKSYIRQSRFKYMHRPYKNSIFSYINNHNVLNEP